MKHSAIIAIILGLILAILNSCEVEDPVFTPTSDLPRKVETMIGTPIDTLRANMLADGWRIFGESANGLNLKFTNANEDSLYVDCVQGDLVTDVEYVVHIPEGQNAPLNTYKAWSETTYTLTEWSQWRGAIAKSPGDEPQIFNGHALFEQVLSSLTSAYLISQSFIINGETNWAQMIYSKGQIVSRIAYGRSFREFDVIPTDILLPEEISVRANSSIDLSQYVEPNGANVNRIHFAVADTTIATTKGRFLIWGKTGTTTMTATMDTTISKTVIVNCLRDLQDGMYVVGPATAVDSFNVDNKLLTKALMAAGWNVATQLSRAGMYEKYIALEANKEFELVLNQGGIETHYGAELVFSNAPEGEDVPHIQVYQGVMVENTTMKVAESGLYHIILDLNLHGDLADKLIIVVPVEWGLRGIMNGWGYTALSAPAFDKTSMTFTAENVLVKKDGQFKFFHSDGWKFQLDALGKVKAQNNFGSNASIDGGAWTSLRSGGKQFPIDSGYWKIELKWTLEGGALENSFTFTPTKTADYTPPYPHMYMTGTDFGNWNWASDGVVELTPVFQFDDGRGEGQFWCIRYFKAVNGFKFSTERNEGSAFNIRGDVSKSAAAITTDSDGNIHVPADGVYMVHYDLKTGKMTIEDAQVYGIGDAFDYRWDTEMNDAKFVTNGQVMEATIPNDGDLRIYATSSIANTEWWTREFIILNNKIEYRGKGGDQARVKVSSGQKITLDFNAGTGSIR